MKEKICPTLGFTNLLVFCFLQCQIRTKCQWKLGKLAPVVFKPMLHSFFSGIISNYKQIRFVNFEPFFPISYLRGSTLNAYEKSICKKAHNWNLHLPATCKANIKRTEIGYFLIVLPISLLQRNHNVEGAVKGNVSGQ